MSDPITVPEVKTIAEVERIVNGSGLWDGTGVIEFSDDGVTWTPAWSPTDEIAHPQFARVAVHRKDVRIPTTAIIRWDEQFPQASEEWAGKWLRSPMRHFGRTVRMVAYRQTFRELLGDVRIEDEADDRTLPAEVTDAVPAAERDWAAEIAAVQSVPLLDAIDREARAARVFTPDANGTALHRALRTRRTELLARTWDAPPAEASAPAIVDEVAPTRAEPKDYLPPQNRAERRKAARKKGGKR
ncbi:hypothetical protein [Microbacterium sp. K24]|uniref:hypothetical protein n=1 Tax=Microbacterium sp. K24 TaxID=2305446 RepID=UPI00109D7BFF|nr:hypothetical protein [Microbacterium sp. K24]